MREVTIFYSYDEMEFLDRDECEAYECKAMQHFRTVDACYAFYNKEGNRIFAPLGSDDANDWIKWLCEAGDSAEKVFISRQLPDDTASFIRYQVGYCIMPEDFGNETGDFQYDWIQWKWVKVG